MENFERYEPFLVCGVDFSDLIYQDEKYLYILVFVCFSSKTVHELASDLSSNFLIFAQIRFIERRGMSQKTFINNATNFVGANL